LLNSPVSVLSTEMGEISSRLAMFSSVIGKSIRLIQRIYYLTNSLVAQWKLNN
jgi:hypothetical protein